MGILSRLFGSDRHPGNDLSVEVIAQEIVARYQQRRVSGECRVDDRLYQDLAQALPQKSAQEVFERFTRRRSRSDQKAEYLLVIEIGIALHDTDHRAGTFGPRKDVSKIQAPDNTPPSAAKTYAKVIEGLPITGADEDAVLFGDLLNE